MAEKVLDTKVTRESNFELLRLVCMFFILVLHVNNGGLFKDLGDIGQSIPASVFESFCIVAVNCFVLISGYFGIKVNWKSFIHLFIFCFSYTFGFAILFSLYHHEILFKRIIVSFFTFSHSPYWFVNVYFGLFLLSPILNNLIKNLTKYDFVVCLVILSIVNIYFGFYSQNTGFNYNGYNIMQFIYLYFIGRYISLYSNRRGRGVVVIYSLVIYIISSLIIATAIVVTYRYGIKGRYILAFNSLNYNNPLIVISSISLFIVFREIKIQSKIINWLAASALAIFLIHGALPYGKLFQYLHQNYGNRWYSGIIYFFAVGVVFIGSILIDKIRMFITNPIETKLKQIDAEKIIQKIMEKVNNKI